MRERKHCSELIVSAPAIDGGGDGGVRGEKTKTFSIHIPSIVCGLILDFFFIVLSCLPCLLLIKSLHPSHSRQDYNFHRNC